MVRNFNFVPAHGFSFMPWVKHVDHIRMTLGHDTVHLFVAIFRQARDAELMALLFLQTALQTYQLHRI